MKKIIGAAAAGLVLTGTAFADVSISAQAQIQSDVFKYTSPTRKSQVTGDTNGRGTDDVGTVKWAQDTKHKDDVTLNASTDNAGAKIVFAVESNIMGMEGASNETNSSWSLTSYQLWMNLGKIRIDAGAYDQRLGKGLSTYDGNWNSNYFAKNKPGIWVPFDGEKNGWGQDSTNLTTIDKDKKRTNFQVSTALNDQLTLLGALFLTKDGTTANGSSDSSDPWIFTPFALGAEYKLSKDSKIGVVAKLNSISLGSDKTTEKTTAGGWKKMSFYLGGQNPSANAATEETAFAKVDDGSFRCWKDMSDDERMKYFGTTDIEDLKSGSDPSLEDPNVDGKYFASKSYYIWEEGTTTTTNEYIKPQNSVWTLAFDYYNKLSSSLEIEATYTLGASLYTNNGKHGAYWDPANKGDSKHLVRDNDVFAHGFDFRVVDKLSSQLSVAGVFNVSYVQGTAVQRSTNRNTPTKGGKVEYKDALAKSYEKGAAGQLEYYAALTANYAASDTVTYQVQTKLEDTNLFSVATGDSSKKHVDYLEGMTLNIRPAILLNVDKTQFFAGFDFGIAGFQTSATGKNNTVYTTYAIPIGLRFKM